MLWCNKGNKSRTCNQCSDIESVHGNIRWDEKILFDIKILDGDLQTVKEWVESENIEFSIFDYQLSDKNTG